LLGIVVLLRLAGWVVGLRLRSGVVRGRKSLDRESWVCCGWFGSSKAA
jgi:hypothetical protein